MEALRRCAAIAALLLLVPLARADAQSTTVRRAPGPAVRLPARVDSGALRRVTRPLLTRDSTRRVSPGVLAITPAAVATQPQRVPTRTRPPAAISRERLTRVLGTSGAALRVVRPSGVTDLPRAADSVRLRPGEFVFRKTADTARRITPAGSGDSTDGTTLDTAVGVPTPPSPAGPPSAEAPDVGGAAATYAMPYRWLTVDSAGVEHVLVPFFILMGGGLSYDVTSRSYRGVALVGVEDALHPNEGPVTLPRPLRLQLTTTRGGTVDPLQLAIAHTSLDYERVSIESDDSTVVRIRTGADPQGIVISVPVRSMTLALIPQQRSLAGLGLSTTDITVALPRGMPRTATASVSFLATGAPVRPASVRVTGADVSTVRLRSGMPGADTIRAYIDGVLAGETVVVFAPPWSFLAATLAGILLGGSARFVAAKRRKRLGALSWDIVKGAPFGLLAAAAGAIGLDWLQLKLDDPGTWIAVMLTAALGAWLTSRLLQRALPVGVA